MSYDAQKHRRRSLRLPGSIAIHTRDLNPTGAGRGAAGSSQNFDSGHNPLRPDPTTAQKATASAASPAKRSPRATITWISPG